jgi:transcriptional regulator with XRE-family HTH domain
MTAPRQEFLIGVRLRRARELRRLGLAEVADRAGLTKSFLSRVERDQASPSISSLLSICEALGVPLAELLDAPPPRLVRRLERPTLLGLPGASVVDSLIAPATQRHVTVVETSIGGGWSSGDSYYALSAEYEVCYILEGVIEMDLEGQIYVLNSGDALSFAGGTPHRWRNASETEPARLLSIMAPALSDQIITPAQTQNGN